MLPYISPCHPCVRPCLRMTRCYEVVQCCGHGVPASLSSGAITRSSAHWSPWFITVENWAGLEWWCHRQRLMLNPSFIWLWTGVTEALCKDACWWHWRQPGASWVERDCFTREIRKHLRKYLEMLIQELFFNTAISRKHKYIKTNDLTENDGISQESIYWVVPRPPCMFGLTFSGPYPKISWWYNTKNWNELR